MSEPQVLSRPSEEEAAVRYSLREGPSLAALVLVAAGIAFVAVGVVDLGLSWLPLHFGTPAWTFATLTRTFSSLPMPAIGVGIGLYGALTHPKTKPIWIRRLAVVCGALGVFLFILGLLYVVAAIQMVSVAPPEAMPGMVKALPKTGFEILAYTALLAFLSAILSRAVVKED